MKNSSKATKNEIIIVVSAKSIEYALYYICVFNWKKDKFCDGKKVQW